MNCVLYLRRRDVLKSSLERIGNITLLELYFRMIHRLEYVQFNKREDMY